ncbi:uncharacterized protein LOC109719629 [Ananas comosus]|uniref:Uncharacterized protein LOC109719629 n=1 Tax=Ananas comosus TaxID=4615 RepID=A0A199UPS4_ANACO|nr:uncharacterized protein LOC109719629 [Ananas comosus]OAY66798.1 hypothetical protein ACMD2_25406 [Ananas comosus]
MGSLMAGWASPVLDEQKVRARRNRSLTREDIETFRKSQGKNDTEEDEQEGQLSPAVASPKKPQVKDALVLKKSVHLVQINDQLEEVEGGKPDITGDWWTRSNWAFLNEPPRDEMNDSAQKYTAQFHVAQLATGTA